MVVQLRAYAAVLNSNPTARTVEYRLKLFSSVGFSLTKSLTEKSESAQGCTVHRMHCDRRSSQYAQMTVDLARRPARTKRLSHAS